ncbi:glutathione S-transferase T3-like [Chenopodium quinoa]|uniref:glutathione S-transferase T3-like n=1 Tax=Chenopodium quinoa TaxID=63459 RepID=UPI000B799B32|nr:glutathione S-transferase T3-like [Chenopodium quinoa]
MGYGEYGAASGYFSSQQPNPNIWESSNVLSEEDEANEECEDDGEGNETPSPHQNFTQMLQQPLQSTPEFRVSGSNNRGWSRSETAALISGYMNTSTDIITGTNQKKGVFWKRVLDAYDAARESNADEISLRTISSLKGRWMRISEAVLKWCGSYDKARKRKGSGYNEDDVIQEAHKIHENSFGRFTFYEEWIQLRKWDKFRSFLDQQTFKPSVGRPHSTPLTDESVGSGSSGKRTRDEGDNSSPTTPTSVGVGDERVARAEGIKKAKSRLKGKDPSSQAFKELETFNSRLQLLGDSMNVSNEAEMKRLEIQEREEARKQRKIELEKYRINWEQLSRLEQKVNREQWEDEMIVILRNNIQRFNNDA